MLHWVSRNTGPMGSTGQTGSTGQNGSTGLAGSTGLTGSTGSNGQRINRIYWIYRQCGTTGSTGEAGSTGLTGSTGSTGQYRINWFNGCSRIYWKHGSTRIDGIDWKYWFNRQCRFNRVDRSTGSRVQQEAPVIQAQLDQRALLVAQAKLDLQD